MCHLRVTALDGLGCLSSVVRGGREEGMSLEGWGVGMIGYRVGGLVGLREGVAVDDYIPISTAASLGSDDLRIVGQSDFVDDSDKRLMPLCSVVV